MIHVSEKKKYVELILYCLSYLNVIIQSIQLPLTFSYVDNADSE